MCGIAGILVRNGTECKDKYKKNIELMIDKLKHRGPDARGLWEHPLKKMYLGHSRLKIIDLSDHANQPFTDGQDVLVFNGEIFNFKELKKDLIEYYDFKTKSDVEVLFYALKHWGTNALSLLNGQFSFAFFNSNKKQLLLARDHVGICPLYYFITNDSICFSSEIKPLLLIRDHKIELNKEALSDYFYFRYNIQNGKTLFGDIKRFPPGNYALINMDTLSFSINEYWRFKFDDASSNSNRENIQDEFNCLLDEEIKAQQIADVPLGLYLSGGIDSGALLNGFCKQIQKPECFTYRFNGDEDIEYQNVLELKNKYNFKSRTVDFGLSSLHRLPEVLEALEEPFGDLIVCSNFDLAEAASKELKVVLSGEGGDESFAGYDHQKSFYKMNRFMPSGLIGRLLPAAIFATPCSFFKYIQNYPGTFSSTEKNRIAKIARLICSSPGKAYSQMIALFDLDDQNGLFKEEMPRPDISKIENMFKHEDLWKATIRAEIEQLTLVVNLLKQDRFSMHFGLEGRVPLVSKNILKFVASLTEKDLFSGENKKLLLNYSRRDSSIKKKAFSVFSSPDIQNYINNMIDYYLTEEKIEALKVFNYSYIRELIFVVKSNRSMLLTKQIQALIVFFSWAERFSNQITFKF
ncbi:MAG: asparagine synthase (glutamine-hydrolyzing) [Oligoflexia bacterium]|nr:asparagine synthase (glutamine-hydrolyzing) [Oligoflexia bacterium]